MYVCMYVCMYEPRNKLNKKQTKYQAKLKQLMVEKTKNYTTKTALRTTYGGKSNNLTMTKKHCLLLMAEKKLLNAKAN